MKMQKKIEIKCFERHMIILFTFKLTVVEFISYSKSSRNYWTYETHRCEKIVCVREVNNDCIAMNVGHNMPLRRRRKISVD